MSVGARIVGGLAIVTLALAGCGDDADGTPTTTTASSDESTTSTTTTEDSATTTFEAAPTSTVASPPDTVGLDDDAQIRAVVEFVGQLFLVAEGPDDPVLSDHLSGPSLESFTGFMRQLKAGDYSVGGERIVDITSVRIEGEIAEVRACVYTDLPTLDSAGNEVNPGAKESVVTVYTVIRADGSWKVDSIGNRDSEGGSEACEIDR